jgi:hypothetical protein
MPELLDVITLSCIFFTISISGYFNWILFISISVELKTVISPLIPLKESINSSLKPFMTDITVIRIDIPKISASDDKIVDIEKALSFLKLKI